MTRRTSSIEPAWFETLYQSDPDPWKFATSDYERGKYAATLAALPPRRWSSALEVGCSIGVLTRQLAPSCDSLLALDVSETALAQARSGGGAARYERRMVPGEWPDGSFDLILFSEVLYYLDAADVGCTAERAVGSLAPGGTVLLVHYLGETDYPLTGDEAVAEFVSRSGLVPDLAERHEGYRIDRLRQE